MQISKVLKWNSKLVFPRLREIFFAHSYFQFSSYSNCPKVRVFCKKMTIKTCIIPSTCSKTAPLPVHRAVVRALGGVQQVIVMIERRQSSRSRPHLGSRRVASKKSSTSRRWPRSAQSTPASSHAARARHAVTLALQSQRLLHSLCVIFRKTQKKNHHKFRFNNCSQHHDDLFQRVKPTLRPARLLCILTACENLLMEPVPCELAPCRNLFAILAADLTSSPHPPHLNEFLDDSVPNWEMEVTAKDVDEEVSADAEAGGSRRGGVAQEQAAKLPSAQPLAKRQTAAAADIA